MDVEQQNLSVFAFWGGGDWLFIGLSPFICLPELLDVLSTGSILPSEMQSNHNHDTDQISKSHRAWTLRHECGELRAPSL